MHSTPGMDPQPRLVRAHSFGAAAATYNAIRPTYPPDALRWALAPLGPGRHTVADVGAGTGILTRVLLALGQDVASVEPDPQMRAELSDATPGATCLPGSAEELPFADASLDAGVAGQAYHWFDRARAHAELARAIRPGGVFAAVWNERDIGVGWLREYSRIVEGARGQQGSSKESGRVMPESFGDQFELTERAEFRHVLTYTPDSLVALMQTRSYYLTAQPDGQAELTAAVRKLAVTHPDLRGRDEFPLPYVTEVYRGVRR